MSFDATRSVWTARASGAIQGGPELYVALAMADRAHSRTGELSAGTRGLAELLGLGRSTVGRALRDLEADGVVEAMARGTGTRATRWRFTLRTSSGTQTGLAHSGDNPPLRPATGTQQNGLASQNPPLRPAGDPIASRGGNETRTRVCNPAPSSGVDTDEAELPRHLRDGIAPEAVPERVAALREALDGQRGAGRTPHTNGAAPPRPPDAYELDRPDIGAEYGPPDDGDGWTP